MRPQLFPIGFEVKIEFPYLYDEAGVLFFKTKFVLSAKDELFILTVGRLIAPHPAIAVSRRTPQPPTDFRPSSGAPGVKAMRTSL